jgi:ABC-type Fe3+ transport system substrate-binding protein
VIHIGAGYNKKPEECRWRNCPMSGYVSLVRRALVASAMTIMVGSVGPAMAQESGGVRQLTVYDDQGLEGLMDEFKVYYESKVGQKLDIQLFKQPGEELVLTTELEARAGNLKADVVIMQHYAIRDLQKRHNLFEAPLNIAGRDDPALIQRYLDLTGDGAAIPVIIFPMLIVYNTKEVAEADVPKKWSDLLNERWAGKIGFGDPEATNGGAAALWYISEYLADRGAPYGWGFYDEMAKLEPHLASSHGSLMEMVVSGELTMSIGSLYNAFVRAKSGDPIGVVEPEEGMPMSIQALAVVANSPEADIGHMLAEWLISKEGVEAILRTRAGAMPSRTDVQNPDTPFPFDFSPERFVVTDGDWMVGQRAEYLRKFREAVR